MDNIQKELIKAGRKDLAQEYYKKISLKISPELRDLLDAFTNFRTKLVSYRVQEEAKTYQKQVNEITQAVKSIEKALTDIK